MAKTVESDIPNQFREPHLHYPENFLQNVRHAGFFEEVSTPASPDRMGCTTAVTKSVLDFWQPGNSYTIDELDKIIGRLPMKGLTDMLPRLLFLLESGYEIHQKGPWDDQRFIDEGWSYLIENAGIDTDNPRMTDESFQAFWTKDMIAQQLETSHKRLEVLAPYNGRSYFPTTGEASVDSLWNELSLGRQVITSVGEPGRGRHEILVTAMERGEVTYRDKKSGEAWTIENGLVFYFCPNSDPTLSRVNMRFQGLMDLYPGAAYIAVSHPFRFSS